MKRTIKNLLYLTGLCLLLISFLFPAVSRAAASQTGTGCSTSPSGQVNSGCTTDPATTSASGLCFYEPTGIIYNCSDVSGSISGGFQPGQCYTNTGKQDSNGNLVWVTDDCSNSAFAQGATCPPPGGSLTGSQASNYCKVTSQETIDPCKDGSIDSGCDTIINNYIDPIVNVLSAGVGIVVVIMIVVGGIQYSTAGDNPQAIQAAKGRIINALIALVIFGLMDSLLQWLIPGGIFNS